MQKGGNEEHVPFKNWNYGSKTNDTLYIYIYIHLFIIYIYIIYIHIIVYILDIIINI